VPVALLLPGLIFFGSARAAALACAIGSMAVLAVGHVPRYMLPVFLFLGFLVAEDAALIVPLAGRFVRYFLAVLVLVQVAVNPIVRALPWKNALQAPELVLAQDLTTYNEAVRALDVLRAPRVLCVSTPPTFRLRARLVYAGIHGETPLMWQIAGTSRTVDEIAKRVKQLGASWMLYNFGMLEWIAERDVSFRWDDRMARLYAGYCRRYLVPAKAPEQCDGRNGGYYVFRILARPPRSAPAFTFFAPGVEQVYRDGVLLRNARRYREATTEFRRVLGLLPDVGQAWNELGCTYALARDWAPAYRCLKPFAERGQLDRQNLLSLGSAALALGRLDEADAVLRKARGMYPYSGDLIDVNLGAVLCRKAGRELERGRLAPSERILAQARQLLLSVHCEWDADLLRARNDDLALVLMLQGDVLGRRGQPGKAVESYNEALRAAPSEDVAAQIRKRLDKASRSSLFERSR
jgi:tetratricopeptide (TPR) repeat protein